MSAEKIARLEEQTKDLCGKIDRIGMIKALSLEAALGLVIDAQRREGNEAIVHRAPEARADVLAALFSTSVGRMQLERLSNPHEQVNQVLEQLEEEQTETGDQVSPYAEASSSSIGRSKEPQANAVEQHDRGRSSHFSKTRHDDTGHHPKEDQQRSRTWHKNRSRSPRNADRKRQARSPDASHDTSPTYRVRAVTPGRSHHDRGRRRRYDHWSPGR